MEVNIKVIFREVKLKDLVYIFGQMEKSMKDNGYKIKYTEKD